MTRQAEYIAPDSMIRTIAGTTLAPRLMILPILIVIPMTLRWTHQIRAAMRTVTKLQHTFKTLIPMQVTHMCSWSLWTGWERRKRRSNVVVGWWKRAHLEMLWQRPGGHQCLRLMGKNKIFSTFTKRSREKGHHTHRYRLRKWPAVGKRLVYPHSRQDIDDTTIERNLSASHGLIRLRYRIYVQEIRRLPKFGCNMPCFLARRLVHPPGKDNEQDLVSARMRWASDGVYSDVLSPYFM